MAGESKYRKSSRSGERVAAEIRRAIRHGELLPGEHVRQESWGDRVGVTGGPTREALKMLVTEGLLSYDAHRGYFVTRLDARDLEQYYQLRRILETEVLRSIRWPAIDEIEHIRGLMDSALSCVREGNTQGAVDASRVVMFTLYDLSPLHIIVREAKRCWDMTMAYRIMLISTVENKEDNNLSSYYSNVLLNLEKGDREGLIALNYEERSEIPTRFRAY